MSKVAVVLRVAPNYQARMVYYKNYINRSIYYGSYMDDGRPYRVPRVDVCELFFSIWFPALALLSFELELLSESSSLS